MPSDDSLIQEAVSPALQSDKIILTLGEHPDMSAEAGSRTEIELPANQIDLLKALSETGKPIISILFCGRPLVLKDVITHSQAVMIAWFPGTEAGNGIADVLSGKKSPVGRLSMSFPRATGQCPVYYNHLPTGRPNTTGEYAPFTNGYIGIKPGPLFPFGYGLTYTSFTYSDITLSENEISISTAKQVLLTASVTIQNTGKRKGTEVVQLYIQDLAGSYSRPIRELKAFTHITLLPGESREVHFPISQNMLEYYIPDKGYTLEPGKFRIYIGPHSESTCYREFKVLL